MCVSLRIIFKLTDSKESFCNSQPQSKVIKLPDKCKVNGQDTFDEGVCPPTPCRSLAPDNGSCTELDVYCCGPLLYDRVDATCDGNVNLPMLMVVSCGCAPCSPPRLFVSGTAKGFDGTALYYGKITINGNETKHAGKNGDFSFEIPIGTERISLLLQDEYLKYLMDTVYAFDIPAGAQGTQYVVVKMLVRGTPVDLQSNVQEDISLASTETGRSLASVTIPPNSFYTEDGSIHSVSNIIMHKLCSKNPHGV